MAIAAFCAIGLIASYSSASRQVFVAGRTLPLPIVVMTLACSASVSMLFLEMRTCRIGTFYDGAVLPIGLGCL